MRRHAALRLLLAAAIGLVLVACASQSADYQPARGQTGKDVMWLPTPQALVDRMLDMAQLAPGEQLVDLGSGDGRLVITAARRGARARGIEYNPDLVAYSKRAAAAAGVADRATFERADIFASDFSQADVVTLFLLQELNMKLRSTLLDMKPGTRVVSNSFGMEGWGPDETATVTEGCVSYCRAFKWIVPAKVRGRWQFVGPAAGDAAAQPFEIDQQFQKFDGTVGSGERRLAVTDGRLDGTRITFTVAGRRHVGRVEGDTMAGTVDGGAAWRAVRQR